MLGNKVCDGIIGVSQYAHGVLGNWTGPDTSALDWSRVYLGMEWANCVIPVDLVAGCLIAVAGVALGMVALHWVVRVLQLVRG